MHLQAPSCLRAHPLATTLWIGTLTVITGLFQLSPQRKSQWIKCHPCKGGVLTKLPQTICIYPLSLGDFPLGDFPRYTGLLEIAISCCHRPGNEGGLCFSITVRLSHETAHLRRDSGPYTNTPLAACIPSYVRAGRGWGTILRGANELRRLIPI